MDVHSFLLLAMSTEEARLLLGVPRGASDDEIRHAQRLLVVKHHPDRGGDLDTIKRINHAADILMGKSRPDYDRREPSTPGDSDSGTGYGPPRQPYKPPPDTVVTFDEAAAKAGVPSNVEWVFITGAQRGVSYSSDEFHRSDVSRVAYGRLPDAYVFVAMRHYVKEEYFIGGAGKQDLWEMKTIKTPRSGDAGKEPAWLASMVSRALRLVSDKAHFNSKVQDAKGWTFGQKLPTSPEISIKHLLVETGEVSGDDPRVKGRKHVIELKYLESMMGDKDSPPPGMYVVEHGSASYKYTKIEGIQIIVNGKPYDLDQGDTQKVAGGRVRFGGKELLNAIFGTYYYAGSSKNLTRMKEGKKIIDWMADNLQSIPENARTTMKAAVAQ